MSASLARSCATRPRSGAFAPRPGVLTTYFEAIRDDRSIGVVAEVMGGVDPAGRYVLELRRAGKPVVSANKQLVARRGADLFAAAADAGVQLRFEASVCAAIPVIKLLREALVVTSVHRVLGIVNGTPNFILSEMEDGASYDEALAEAERRGFAEADPTEDVSGADAAAKMAILATVAFGSRVTFDDVEYDGIEQVTPLHVAAAREMGMAVRLIGAAPLVGGRFDVRVYPALVDRHHPLAAVEGAFNAVMLQGDAIREIARRRRPARRPRPSRRAARGARCLGRAARPAPGRRPRGPPRRDARGARRPCRGGPSGDRGPPGGPRRALGAPRDLGPRRLRARLGLTLPFRGRVVVCLHVRERLSLRCVTHPREIRRYARKRVVVRGGPRGLASRPHRVARVRLSGGCVERFSTRLGFSTRLRG